MTEFSARTEQTGPTRLATLPVGGALRTELEQADRFYMSLALALARQAEPAPNPQVGAVVVRRGQIVGSGYHQRAGGPHAEIFALRAAGELAFGSTLYVTLEPCNHVGRTPPCVDAVQRAGVRRVVFGCRDPNPLVRGSGAARLRTFGIETVESMLCASALGLIATWVAKLGG